jgi:hypothetical protein
MTALVMVGGALQMVTVASEDEADRLESYTRHGDGSMTSLLMAIDRMNEEA